MACWQQLLLLLLVALVVAEESNQPDPDRQDASAVSAEPLPVPAALHRQKRHEVEIHRVIKRRSKLPPPPPPRGRKPRPPRRPASKPRGKYGPPNVNYPPLSHYVPQSIDDPYSSGFEASFGDHHGSFGEPPIHPSPTFGSPPFAYGQTITSYEGSSYGKPSYEGSSFGKPSYEGSSFGKPSYEGSSFGKHSGGYQGGSIQSFGKPSFELSPNFDGGFSKPSFGSGLSSTFESKVPPSFLDSSSGFDGFPGAGKHSPSFTGSYSHSFSHTGIKQPSFADSTAINTYTTPSGKGNYYTDTSSSSSSSSSFGDVGSKHQLPLEKYRKDPYKTPITSYEVPSNPKSNLFEPSGDFETSYKRSPHNGGVSSTHSTSHSSVGTSEEEYIPSLPTRYDQEQFHTPTKTNPNKPPHSTLQTISGTDDHFNSFTSYYDGGSESQRIPVKSNQPPTPYDASDEQQFPTGPGSSGGKRFKGRRKKKPKLPSTGITHNLDTDDLRDAFGSSSDFHQVAIDADEFLDFEPKKQIKHSKPAGVTHSKPAEDSKTPNFVLLSSQNKGGGGAGKGTGQRAPPLGGSSISTSKSVEYEGSKHFDLSNYFQANGSPNNQQPAAPHQRPSKPIGLDDLNILSIQKSNSHSYYAGSSQGGQSGSDRPGGGGFQPTRRRDTQHYRSATGGSLDYTMLDEDEEENYDDISDVGTRGNRKKKDLSDTTINQ